eukprot:5497403-Amphidinium_carterae.2
MQPKEETRHRNCQPCSLLLEGISETPKLLKAQLKEDSSELRGGWLVKHHIVQAAKAVANGSLM